MSLSAVAILAKRCRTAFSARAGAEVVQGVVVSVGNGFRLAGIFAECTLSQRRDRGWVAGRPLASRTSLEIEPRVLASGEKRLPERHQRHERHG